MDKIWNELKEQLFGLQNKLSKILMKQEKNMTPGPRNLELGQFKWTHVHRVL